MRVMCMDSEQVDRIMNLQKARAGKRNSKFTSYLKRWKEHIVD